MTDLTPEQKARLWRLIEAELKRRKRRNFIVRAAMRLSAAVTAAFGWWTLRR